MSRYFNKKGQAVTEFLTRYGWAVLILTIIIVVLAGLGVFRAPSTPNTCSTSAPFACVDVIINDNESNSSSGFISNIVLKANNVNSLSVGAYRSITGTCTSVSLVGTLDGNGKNYIGLTCPKGNKGDKEKGEIDLIYGISGFNQQHLTTLIYSATRENIGNITIVGSPQPPVYTSPSFTSAFITTTDVTKNDTTVNLTVDWINPSGYNSTNTITNITSNWFEDNISILRLNFPFGVITSNQVIDYSGFNNNGTIVRTQNTNRIGDAVCNVTNGKFWAKPGCFFDTGNGITQNKGDFINVTDNSNLLSFNDAFTVEFWYYYPKSNWNFAPYQSFPYQGLIGKRRLGGDRANYFVNVGGAVTQTAFWQWGFIPVTQSCCSYKLVTLRVGPYLAQRWTYFAGTFEQTGNNVIGKMYFNGILANQTTFLNVRLNNSIDNQSIGIGDDLAFGATGGSSQSIGELFNGYMSDIRIWHKNLSAQQIYQNYLDDVNNRSLTTFVNSSIKSGSTYQSQLVVTDSTSNSPFKNTTELLIK